MAAGIWLVAFSRKFTTFALIINSYFAIAIMTKDESWEDIKQIIKNRRH